MDENENTTDATRGQDLRSRVEIRKRELEQVFAKLPEHDLTRSDLEIALSAVAKLLPASGGHISHVVAISLNRWLEENKHLGERHPEAT